MLTDFYATKTSMTQAWTADGKRLAVTKLKAQDNIVTAILSPNLLEVGYGRKKQKNISKPLLTKYNKGGFSFYPAKTEGARFIQSDSDAQMPVGASIPVQSVLSVGDVVEVRGVSKGRGFAGAVKRYGFHGGPKTHGQSDRTRAVGSIGAGTTPGRVWKGKRMPGHYGVETKTVTGLVVVHIDKVNQEIWISGPVPGHINSFVCIHKTGRERHLELDAKASGISPVIEDQDVQPSLEEEQSATDVQAEEAPAQEAQAQESIQDSSEEKVDSTTQEKGKSEA